jgi:exonuclease III
LDSRGLQYEDGSTLEERECFYRLIKERNLVDSFRNINPNDKIWTWVPNKLWNKNVMGCRIDFVLIDKNLIDKVKESKILIYKGSDHRPTLTILS